MTKPPDLGLALQDAKTGASVLVRLGGKETAPESWTIDTALTDYTILRRKRGSELLEFEVYAVKGTGDKGERYYELKGGSGSDFEENIAKAAPYASGSIRFDGCINYRFDAQDECMLHECGRGAFAEIAKLFEHIYDLAAKAMPEHQDYLQ